MFTSIPWHVHVVAHARLATQPRPPKFPLPAADNPLMTGSGHELLRRNALARGSVAWIVIAIWLTCTAAAFWWFEIRDWRSFSAPGARLFEMRAAAEVESWFRTHVGIDASGQSHLTFVHLYRPDCRCNGFTEPHLQRLMDRYQSRGVRFIAALSPSFDDTAGPGRHPLGLPVIQSSDRSLITAGVNTAPAVLIFDANGRLLYYGPYSDSAWCGTEGGLVEPVLDLALAGRQPSARTTAIRGCFCAW
jgi:Domain of unknown function (DUF6436)